jgi:hypothetical protein
MENSKGSLVIFLPGLPSVLVFILSFLVLLSSTVNLSTFVHSAYPDVSKLEPRYQISFLTDST